MVVNGCFQKIQIASDWIKVGLEPRFELRVEFLESIDKQPVNQFGLLAKTICKSAVDEFRLFAKAFDETSVDQLGLLAKAVRETTVDQLSLFAKVLFNRLAAQSSLDCGYAFFQRPLSHVE